MKWSVRKLPGNRAWGIYDDNGNLHDAEPEHADAMDWAHWYSLVQDLAQPGALAAFMKMQFGAVINDGKTPINPRWKISGGSFTPNEVRDELNRRRADDE